MKPSDMSFRSIRCNQFPPRRQPASGVADSPEHPILRTQAAPVHRDGMPDQNLGPDRDHADEQRDRCEGGGFFDDGAKHIALPW
jgi:hypothetical protein